MTKTEFAGLEVVAPGGSLSQDGYAFQSENPVITDLLLKIGALLHRHDAHAAMADPDAAPTITVSAGGDGTLASNTSIYIAYTLNDPDGGETLPSPTAMIVTPAGYSDPGSAPTAVLDFSAGTLLANTNLYAITVTDGNGGETALGPPAIVTVTPSAQAQVDISGLSALVNASSDNATTAGWRMWRSLDGGNTWYLMATGAYSVDTWTDTGAIAGDCSVSPPASGTTGNSYSMTASVPGGGQPASATFINIYGCEDGTFSNPCLLATLPIADLGTDQNFTSLAYQAGSPPSVSSCIGGANQIDPDTDLINWHWKTPVATEADLPADGNDDGDVRVAIDSQVPYIWSASATAWLPWSLAALTVGDGTNTESGVTSLTFDGATLTVGENGQATITIADSQGGGSSGSSSISVSDGNVVETGVSTIQFQGVGITVAATDDGEGDCTVTLTTGLSVSDGTYVEQDVDSITFQGATLVIDNTGAVTVSITTGTTPPLPVLTGTAQAWSADASTPIVLPTTMDVGDLMLLGVEALAGGLAGTPTGWTQVADNALGGSYNSTLLVYTRTATANDIGATVTLTPLQGSDPQIAALVRSYSGTAGVVSNPVTSTDGAPGSGFTLSPDEVSSPSANCLQVSFYGVCSSQGDDTVAFLSQSSNSQSQVGAYSQLAAEEFPIPRESGDFQASGGATFSGGAASATGTVSLVLLPAAPLAFGAIAANTQADAYTFQDGDVGCVVEYLGASAVDFTIEANATTALPIGALIEVFQYGAGQVTIVGAGDVVLRSDGDHVNTAAQYATIRLRQRAIDEWVLSGDLA